MDDLETMTQRWGIVPRYVDNYGENRDTSSETRQTLLRAMGVDSEASQKVGPAAVIVVRPGEVPAIDGAGELILEDGAIVRVSEKLPADLPLGYHHLVRDDGHEVFVISAPSACYLRSEFRTWGWAVQLYAARSRQSWGIGDLRDLKRLARWSAKQNAGALLINPLSAVAPTLPQRTSPYYPSSRRFRNPLYIAIENVPGANAIADQIEPLAVEAKTLNGARLIDRDRIFPLKMAALETLWNNHARTPTFEQYVARQGESLHAFAAYCILAEEHGRDWRKWPEQYRRPDDKAVEQFAEQRADRLRFHQWLQWLLDEQLADAAADLPLVNDLPIGVDPGGADAWQWQDVLATDVTIGAPPDQFNSAGQDWGMPPFIPHRLRQCGYRPFIETVRAAMRHAGGLRIDHVMGLFRLFWIPAGVGPRDGAYVRYPADEMLAIVALESHRAEAWVAGEDLGTVEKSVRESLTTNRMFCYRVMWFEDDPPKDYPELCLAALTTHDLPTVAGLWNGTDFAEQQRLGINPSEEGYRQIRDRLCRFGGLREDQTTAVAVERAYAALSAAPSSVLVANLDDALMVDERPNMPGTTDQWPNWSIALPMKIEDIETADLPGKISQRLSARG